MIPAVLGELMMRNQPRTEEHCHVIAMGNPVLTAVLLELNLSI